MLKEKLQQIKKYESQAADSIKKAGDDSTGIIAMATAAAEVTRRQAEADAASKVRVVEKAIDAELEAEIAAIDEASLKAIDGLKAGSPAGIEKAAVEIARRVAGGAGV